MQTSAPVMWMRGGTSKGGYFLASDLPADRDRRELVRLSKIINKRDSVGDALGLFSRDTEQVAAAQSNPQKNCIVTLLQLLQARILSQDGIVDNLDSTERGNELCLSLRESI